MPKRPHSQNSIPAFNGSHHFKPVEPVQQDDSLIQADDSTMAPEERGTIKRYLRYADTFLNGSDETPAENEPVPEASLTGTKRPAGKKAA